MQVSHRKVSLVRTRLGLVRFALLAMFGLAGPLMAGTADDVPSGHGVSLESFAASGPAGRMNDGLPREMARRVGCEGLSQTLVWPPGGDIGKAVGRLLVRHEMSFYQRAQRELWRSSLIDTRCHMAGWDKTRVDPALRSGLKRFVDVATANDPGMTRLTLVAVGGLGSRFFNSMLMGAELDEWNGLVVGQAKVAIRLLRWRCTQYASDKVCAPELLTELDRDAASAQFGAGDRYLFLAYSQGGLTILDDLYLRPDIRSKTVGVVTMASPIGGTPVSYRMIPVLRSIKSKLGVLVTLGKLVDSEDFGKLLIKGPTEVALAGQVLNLDEVEDAYRAIAPATRQAFLEGEFVRRDYSRADGSPLKVFHVAAVLDMAKMPGMPRLTVKKGWIVPEVDETAVASSVEASMIKDFADYPLNDTVVPLQSAVIPRNAIPHGLESELVGVFDVDHSHAAFGGLTGLPDDPLVGTVAVDALLAALATRMETQGGHQ